MSEAAQTGSEFVFVYTPLPDRETAEEMAETLVVNGFSACVNIFPGVVSYYQWEGEIQRDEEVVAFIKTRRSMVAQVIDAARDLHPYDVPAFLVLPIDDANADYLEWARGQVKS